MNRYCVVLTHRISRDGYEPWCTNDRSLDTVVVASEMFLDGVLG